MEKIWIRRGCPALADIGIEQIGIGAFYYIASTAVIGVVNYASDSRSDQDMALFFALLSAVLLCATMASALVTRLYDYLADRQGLSFVVIVLAAMVCACFSMFGPLRSLLYVGALLTGCACVLLTLSWDRGLSRMPVRADLFALPAALLVAVGCYFVYRLLSFFSLAAADGWHVTVGVVGMLALLLAYSPEYNEPEAENGAVRPFLLLGGVAAVFATGGGLLAFLAGFPGSGQQAQFTPYFILEIIGAVTIALLCVVGNRLLRSGRLASVGSARAYSAASLTILLLLGAVSGVALAANNGNGLLWEASVWVLVVAALALGMRTSLYLIQGMVIGVMFAAWCFGQLIALAVILFGNPWFWLVAGVASCTYVAAVLKLIDRKDGYAVPKESASGGPVENIDLAADSADVGGLPGTENTQGAARDLWTEEVCRKIGEDYRLTAREIEVLCLIAEGRSARFIADDLVISYNTARSHMRNVYEKLGIHSKQDIISLVQSWE